LRALARPVARLAVAFIAIGAVVMVSPAPATAGSVAYPVLGQGDSGTNVRAIQYLLRRFGYSLAVDGTFEASTRSAVRAFQARQGLTADGVVGPLTWSRLVIPVAYDHRGDAVKAVQLLLNSKRGAGLPMTGWFGPMTRAAVVAFQRHEGLSPDGQVGPITWRYLIAHFEQPNFAAASLCAYSNPTNGDRAHWGTSSTVAAMEHAAAVVYRAGLGPVAVGDISLEHGGDIAGHVTHEVGLDADIRPMRRAGNECSFGVTWYRWSDGRKICCNPAYDRAATRALIKALFSAARGHLDVVAFNDPQLIAEGLTMRLAGHDDHLHASFCEVTHPVAGYSC
jgi:peptidoglycan hydrolase-like protein with peptidoglycan-binding domain